MNDQDLERLATKIQQGLENITLALRDSNEIQKKRMEIQKDQLEIVTEFINFYVRSGP